MTQPSPLKGAEAIYGPIAVATVTFLVVLENTIVNVSVAAIAGDLAVSPSQGAWVISAYAMANAMSVPLTGWLTKRFGQVHLFLASLAIFTVFSGLCGFATNLEMLVVLRVLAGLAAGPLLPLTQTLLLTSYPPHKAGHALGLWSMISLLAPITGPVLGGVIVDSVSWSWIFFIKVPLGIVVLAICWTVYRRRNTATQRTPVDAVGLALLFTWISALQLTLDLGKDYDWFDSPVIVALACAAVASLALFLVWELLDNPHPVVDLALFRRRNFALATIAITLAQSTFFGGLVLLPLWMQTVLGYSATQAGLLMAPMGVLAVPLSFVLSRKIDRIEPRSLIFASLILFAYIWWLRSEFTLQVDPWMIAGAALLQGVAMMSHFMPLNRIALDGLPPESYAAGMGLVTFLRQSGGALGVSVSVTLWDLRTQVHRAELVERATGYDPATGATLELLQGAGMGAAQSLAALERIIEQQARMMAVADIFWGSALLCLLLACFVWVVRPASGGRITMPAMSATSSD